MRLSHKKLIFLTVIPFILLTPLIAQAIRINNPLGEGVTILDVVVRVIKALFGFTAIMALLNFVIAGIGILLSRGDAEKLRKNRDNLIWTTVAIILFFAAYAILSFVFQVITGEKYPPPK
jgi:amino acid transporter